jgi:hypothetical protein
MKAEAQKITLSIQVPKHLYQKIKIQARNLNQENSAYIENIIAEYFNDPIQKKIETFFNEKIIFKYDGCETVGYVYKCYLKHSGTTEPDKNKFIRIIKSLDNRIKLEFGHCPGEKGELIFSGIWINREAIK